MLAVLCGCGKANSRNSTLPKATYGQLACDYTAGSSQRNLGNFDLQLVQSTTDVRIYFLYLTPIALTRLSDLINITASGSDGVYREVVQQTRLYLGKTMKLGALTVDELAQYSSLVISVYQPGLKNPLESTSKFLNICQLPQPGDGVASTPSTF